MYTVCMQCVVIGHEATWQVHRVRNYVYKYVCCVCCMYHCACMHHGLIIVLIMKQSNFTRI